MTQQEYLDNKNNLDNPQVIVCVNREGGPRKPKAPKWFTDYMDKFRIEVEQMMDTKLKSFAQLNDLKYEEKFKKFAKLNNLKYEQ